MTTMAVPDESDEAFARRLYAQELGINRDPAQAPADVNILFDVQVI
jgi:hypothetical protein